MRIGKWRNPESECARKRVYTKSGCDAYEMLHTLEMA